MSPFIGILLSGFILPLAGPPPLHPTPAVVQVRMILLKSGMTKSKVTATLGITGYTNAVGVLSHLTSEPVGFDHTFVASYLHKPGSKDSILAWATLYREKQAVAWIPAGPRPESEDLNGIDPALIKSVIEAIQSQPPMKNKK